MQIEMQFKTELKIRSTSLTFNNYCCTSNWFLSGETCVSQCPPGYYSNTNSVCQSKFN